MSPSRRGAVIDGSIALGLALALVVVFFVDRATRRPITQDAAMVSTHDETAATSRLRLAVTPPQYDDMGRLLDQLGAGYEHSDIRLEDLESATKLAVFDVIFFTCGTDASGWVMGEPLGSLARPGTRMLRFNPDALERIKDALRSYVGQGGILYASDWRLDLIRICFPEWAEGANVVSGAAQTMTAEVVDPDLRERIGSTVELKFDLNDWRPAQIGGRGNTVYLRGRYQANDGSTNVEAPLLVKVPFGKGAIIFTSFHNEKVNSELETKLLQFLVFTAVTAREEERTKSEMLNGNLTLQDSSLVSASSGNPTVTRVYNHPTRGKIRFALSFNNQGGRLKLSVRGPDGTSQEKEGTSSFSIDVVDAAPGRWTFTITALKLPHENFPYKLNIGTN